MTTVERQVRAFLRENQAGLNEYISRRREKSKGWLSTQQCKNIDLLVDEIAKADIKIRLPKRKII